MQLFCFTFAGGNAVFFSQLEEKSGVEIEFIKLEYPGHGIRMKEPLCRSFAELTENLYSIIKKSYKGQSYALLGYSMGSFSAVDMYYYIKQKNEIRLPSHIFLAAHAPHTLIDFSGLTAEQKDELAKQRTIEFGAVPENLINNKSFWRLYLPIYRTDYQMISDYRIGKWGEKIEVPLTVFYSNEDTPFEEIAKWQDYAEQKVEYVRYDGTHFFITEHAKEMMKVIEERLGSVI